MLDQLFTLCLLVSMAGFMLVVCIEPSYRRDGRLDVMQPGIVVALFWSAYIIAPGFYLWLGLDYVPNYGSPTRDPEGVNYALLLHLLGLIGFGFGYRLPIRGVRPQPRFPAAIPLNTYVLAALAIVGLLLKLWLISRLGDWNTLLIRLSPHLRGLLLNSAAGSALSVPEIIMSTFLDAVAVLALVQAQRARHLLIWALLLLCLSASLNFLIMSKRSVVVSLLLYPIVLAHYRSFFSLGKALSLLVGLVAVVVTSLYARIILPNLTYGLFASAGELFADRGGMISMYINSAELSLLDMVVVAVNRTNSILHDMGGTIGGFLYFNFAAFSFLIPRVLWPDKPSFIDVSHIMYQQATGNVEDVGFSVGVVGVTYILFGIPGIMLGMGLLGIIVQRIYMLLSPMHGNPVSAAIYCMFIWYLFQFLRFGTLGYTFLLFLSSSVLILGGLLCASYFLGKRRMVLPMRDRRLPATFG